MMAFGLYCKCSIVHSLTLLLRVLAWLFLDNGGCLQRLQVLHARTAGTEYAMQTPPSFQ